MGMGECGLTVAIIEFTDNLLGLKKMPGKIP
jgi:hypothetical protein